MSSSLTFGHLLRRIRASRSITQRDLSERAGTSVKHMCALELGDARPTRAMCIGIAKALPIDATLSNLLLHAAGFAPAFDADLSVGYFALQAAYDTVRVISPTPCLAFTSAGRPLFVNDEFAAFAETMFGVSRTAYELGEADARLAALFLPSVLSRLANFEEVISHVIARLLRDAAIEGAGSPPDRVVQALCGAFPHLANVSTNELPTFHDMVFRIDDTEVRLKAQLLTLGSQYEPAFRSVRFMAFFPLDAATSRWLGQVARSRRDDAPALER